MFHRHGVSPGPLGRSISVILVAFGSLLGAGMLPEAPVLSPVAYFADDDAGCHRCQSGPCSSTNAHITNAVSGGDDWVGSSIASGGGFNHWGPHACVWGKTCESHVECGEPGGGDELPCEPDCDADSVLAAVAAFDTVKVASVLARNELGFVLNEKRLAVQRFDCTGSVVVHIPVSASLVHAIRHRLGSAGD